MRLTEGLAGRWAAGRLATGVSFRQGAAAAILQRPGTLRDAASTRRTSCKDTKTRMTTGQLTFRHLRRQHKMIAPPGGQASILQPQPRKQLIRLQHCELFAPEPSLPRAAWLARFPLRTPCVFSTPTAPAATPACTCHSSEDDCQGSSMASSLSEGQCGGLQVPVEPFGQQLCDRAAPECSCTWLPSRRTASSSPSAGGPGWYRLSFTSGTCATRGAH